MGRSSDRPIGTRVVCDLTSSSMSSAIAANSADRLLQTAKERILDARALSLEDVDGRPLAIKLRDGIARLFTPYL